MPVCLLEIIVAELHQLATSGLSCLSLKTLVRVVRLHNRATPKVRIDIGLPAPSLTLTIKYTSRFMLSFNIHLNIHLSGDRLSQSHISTNLDRTGVNSMHLHEIGCCHQYPETFE